MNWAPWPPWPRNQLWWTPEAPSQSADAGPLVPQTRKCSSSQNSGVTFAGVAQAIPDGSCLPVQPLTGPLLHMCFVVRPQETPVLPRAPPNAHSASQLLPSAPPPRHTRRLLAHCCGTATSGSPRSLRPAGYSSPAGSEDVSPRAWTQLFVTLGRFCSLACFLGGRMGTVIPYRTVVKAKGKRSQASSTAPAGSRGLSCSA